MKWTTRAFPWWPAAAVALVVACGQEATSPPAADTNLSAAEADFLALSLDRTADAAMGDAFGIGAASGPPSIPGSGTWTFSFESTRDCPEGGQVMVSGSGQFSRDRETGTAEMAIEATKSIEACAFLRGDVLFTVNGSAELSVNWKRVDGQLVEAERHISGFLSVVTSDGRSWECTFELHSVFDPATRRVQVTGNLCGRTIDNAWTRG